MRAVLTWSISSFVALAACSSTEPETVSTTELELATLQLQKVVAPDAAANDHFANSVAVEGSSAVIGSSRDDIGANVDQGSAHVLVSNGNSWFAVQKLTAGGASGFFGTAVAITGGTLHETVVATANQASPRPNGSRGAAYVFRNTGPTFVQEAVIVPSAPANNEIFGDSVALLGDTLIVGGDASYVFTRSGTTWTEQQRIPVRGTSVALAGDTVILGDGNASVGANANQGVARVFVRTGPIWTQQQVLSASDGQAGDRFGTRVALSGDLALIGDPDDLISGVRRGSAYFFRRVGTAWTEEQKVVNSDGAADDRFGSSVAVAGDIAVIGASGHEHLGQNANHGSAYLFLRPSSTWVQDREIRSADGQNNDFFGGAVALSGNTVFLGADNDDGPLPAQGSAYAFRFAGAIGEPCASNNGCTSGFCADGRCCDTACNGSCNACSVATGRRSMGTARSCPRARRARPPAHRSAVPVRAHSARPPRTVRPTSFSFPRPSSTRVVSAATASSSVGAMRRTSGGALHPRGRSSRRSRPAISTRSHCASTARSRSGATTSKGSEHRRPVLFARSSPETGTTAQSASMVRSRAGVTTAPVRPLYRTGPSAPLPWA
jgi:hypothetical protein